MKKTKHKPSAPPSLATREKMVRDWNATHAPKGVQVTVRLDSGATINTVTESAAWLLGGHSPVIMLQGITGAYDLERVTPGHTQPQD